MALGLYIYNPSVQTHTWEHVSVFHEVEVNLEPFTN